MHIFTIRDIENLTGIKAHTLRIWEQRFDVFTSKRKQSQHRFYDNEDLKKLLRIAFLYHNGWKISKIAALTENEVISEIQNSKIVDSNYINYITRLIEAAIDFDESAFIEIIKDIKSKIGFEKCIIEVCYPYLKKLGLLWSTNNVIPAQEHFSSYIIQNMIIVETEQLSSATNGKTILLSSPKGEFHELPLLFINYLLKKNKWTTLYLGPNIKIPEMQLVCSSKSVSYVYMHLLTNFTGFDATDYFEELSRSLPGINIIASGEGVKKIQRQFTNLTLLKTDQQIYDFIQVSGKA
ncbi:MAG TPA: MerR family transcriptional regulator [Flavisolibacter sp.]|nr:MerR family transcriptional regulator [Flavisolibacter sp.]